MTTDSHIDDAALVRWVAAHRPDRILVRTADSFRCLLGAYLNQTVLGHPADTMCEHDSASASGITQAYAVSSADVSLHVLSDGGFLNRREAFRPLNDWEQALVQAVDCAVGASLTAKQCMAILVAVLGAERVEECLMPVAAPAETAMAVVR